MHQMVIWLRMKEKPCSAKGCSVRIGLRQIIDFAIYHHIAFAMYYGYSGISTAVPFCCVIEAEVYPFLFCSHAEMLRFLAVQSSATTEVFDIEMTAHVFMLPSLLKRLYLQTTI